MKIRRLRWWRAAALALLALVGAVLVTSWAIVRIYGPEFTRERVEALLSDALGQPAHVGAVHLRPWWGRLSLVDLDVPARPGPPGGVLLRAGAIDVNVDIASLWRRELTLSVLATGLRLEMDAPRPEAGGRDLFPLPEYVGVGPLRVRIGSVRVRGSHVLIRQPEAGLAVAVAGADVTARPAAGELDVSGRLDTLRVEAPGRAGQVERVAIEGRLSADLVRIRRVGWRWQGEAFQLDGEVRHPWAATRALALSVTGDVALAPLARAAGLDRKLHGTAQVAAEITGLVGAPRIAGRVRIPELGLAGATVRDVAIDGQWLDHTLRLDPIQARLGAGRLNGRLEASPLAAGGASIALDLTELVLPGALADLGPGTVLARGRIRDGGVDLIRAEAAWRGLGASLDGRIATGPPLAIRGNLTADLREVGQALGLGPVSGRASVSAELTGREATPVLAGRAEIADLVAGGRAVEPIAAAFRMAAAAGEDTRWEGTVESPRVRWEQAAIESITAVLAVDGGRVELIRGRARAAAVPVEATGVWEWSGSGRGRATLGPVALGTISGVPPALRLDGTGRATVDAAVERGVASASALVDLDQVSASGVTIGAGRAELHTRGDVLKANVVFPARRLRAEAAGRIATGEALTARLELDELPLQPLLRDLGSAAAERVEARVSARGELSIPIGQPADGRGTVRVTPDGLRLLGEPWASQGPIVLRWEGPRLLVERLRLSGPVGSLTAGGLLAGPGKEGLSLALEGARLPGGLAGLGRGTASAELRLTGGGLELTRLDARWPGLTGVASGRAQADGTIALTARVDAEMAGLGAALGMPGVAGRATLTADARGRGDGTEAVGSVRAPALQVRGAAVSDIEVPFRVSRSALIIQGVRARLGASRVSADGSVSWPGSGPSTADLPTRDARFKAEVRAPALRLEDLGPLLPPALHGRGELALAVRAEGTPRAWRGSGTLASSLVELAPGSLRQLRAAVTLDETRIQVTDLGADAFGAPVRATATWDWAGGGSAKAALGPAPLAGLAIVPAALDLRGTGRATIEVAMRSPADLTGGAHAVLDDVTVAGVPLGRGRIDVTARDGAARGELVFPEQRLRASGSARIDAGGTLTAEAAVPGIDLAPLIGPLLPAPMAVSGTLSARATARLPVAEPRRGEALVSIDPLRLVVAGEAWESRGPVEVRWAQGGLTLAAVRLAAKDGLVSAAGTVGADGRLDARASAQVPLAMLAAARPEVRDVRGILDLSLHAAGTLGAPTFAGEGAIRGGSAMVRDRPETLRDVEARFTLSSQGLQLHEATGSVGGGRVQARGAVALRGWHLGGYRMRIEAQNVAVGPIEGLSSAWDADLELSGITRQAQLEGRVRLARGVYNRDFSMLSLALSPARAAAADTGPPLRLQVKVDLADNLVVRSRTANLRAGGVLSVEGTASRPVVFGSVESRDGRIVFRGRDWSVNSASVRFADPRRLDPFLDVLATSRIGEYDVTMQITGPVSDITVRLSSTPRLSQNDLLSLVAFGVTGADLRESPATVLLGEAGALLARNVLGVEPTVTGLRISTGSSPDGTSELRGFPGEERTTPGSSRNTTTGRRERVRVEYQLLAPLFLAGEYDREGGYGADVILRFRFRR